MRVCRRTPPGPTDSQSVTLKLPQDPNIFVPEKGKYCSIKTLYKKSESLDIKNKSYGSISRSAWGLCTLRSVT